MASILSNLIYRIQEILSFYSCTGIHFEHGGSSFGKIAVTGFALGLACGFHILLLLISISLLLYSNFYPTLVPVIWLWIAIQWSSYFSALCTFHFLEFLMTAIYQPMTLTYDSYLVNHSKSYTIAALVSWTEFWIEAMIFREYKCQYYVIITGIIMVLAGQYIRSLAMKTCGESFSHFLMTTKSEGHALITHGIYNTFRHPSYFGWFYWSLGTQLILCNPISIIGYLIAALRFFYDRIEYEENVLFEIYGELYLAYIRRTWIGIPGISSSKLLKNCEVSKTE